MHLAHGSKVLAIFRRLRGSLTHMEAFGFEPPDRVYRFLPASSTAIEVMYSGIRAIEADLDRQVLVVGQHLKLSEALPFQQNAVAEHSDLHSFQAVAQHREDVVQDEWFTPGKKDLRHSYLSRFINEAADLWERESVALGPHKGLCHAITAGKIAVVV